MSNASCIEAESRRRRLGFGALPLLGVLLVAATLGAMTLGRYP